MLWTEHRKTQRDPNLDVFLQAQSLQYIDPEIKLGVGLLQNLTHTPDIPYHPLGLSDMHYSNLSHDCGKAFAQALLLCASHNDLALFNRVMDWSLANTMDCLTVPEKHIVAITERLAQLNEKDLLEKTYDIFYPEKDLTKLQRFRFSLGAGVSPGTLEAIVRSSIEALSWEVLEWVRPLVKNYDAVAPRSGAAGPSDVFRRAMFHNFALDPQYDEILTWWLAAEEQDEIKISIFLSRPDFSTRRVELALQHLNLEHLTSLAQNASQRFQHIMPAVERELSQRQHNKITDSLAPVVRSTAARKM